MSFLQVAKVSGMNFLTISAASAEGMKSHTPSLATMSALSVLFTS